MMTATQQSPTHMLADLLKGLVEGVDASWLATAVSGLQLDSRLVTSGDVFVACNGELHDGRDFIEQAIVQGAAAVLAQAAEGELVHRLVAGVPVIAMANLSAQLSEIAGRFYHQPSKKLAVLAVTGTNGKTSCTQLFVQLLNSVGVSCGAIGTLGSGVDGVMDVGVNTTPDAITVQRLMSQWLAQSVPAVAMEVSSHGLALGRVNALQYDAAIFTNLSRDHMDFHGTMQAYGKAKAKLFQQSGLKFAIVNADDPFCHQLKKMTPESVQLLDYSVENNKAAVFAQTINCSRAGVSAELVTPWGKFALQSPLLGVFNLSNLLAVITALAVMGYRIEDMLPAVKKLQPAPGRMELLAAQSDIDVVIDYAHTPDALQNALHALREHCTGKLWCVFGCGGDRDQGKRAMMGAIANRLADHCIVTSDNPRSESAATIAEQVTAEMSPATVVELDRSKAIDQAIQQAQPGDWILIAGKGHELYQQVAGQSLAFSDFKQARLALAARGGQ